jgi:ASC-1-like (ASCH) protein
MSTKYLDTIEDTLTESPCEDTEEPECRPKKVHIFRFPNDIECDLYEQVKLKNKLVDARNIDDNSRNIEKGDKVLFSDKKRGILECKVLYTNKYKNIKEFIKKETPIKAIGDNIKCNISEAVNIYSEYIDTSKEIISFAFEFIHEYRKYYKTLKDPWFTYIKNGTKKVEGRLNKSWVKMLNPYDMIEFEKIPVKEEFKEIEYKDEKLNYIVKDESPIPKIFTQITTEYTEDFSEDNNTPTIFNTDITEEDTDIPIIIEEKGNQEKEKISVLVTNVIRKTDGKKLTFVRLFDKFGLENVLPYIDNGIVPMMKKNMELLELLLHPWKFKMRQN